MAKTPTKPTPQQGGATTPTQQAGQTSGTTQQQGQPIYRDWASI
jgi:hypothetical protein